MNTAQRFARISAVVDNARHMITQNPANAALQQACITSVANLLKDEPWPANYAERSIPGWFPDCARALLGVLPRCASAELMEGSVLAPVNWVDFDVEENDDEDEDGEDEDDNAIAPAMQPHDMCDDPC
jgi:hypothetical protein